MNIRILFYSLFRSPVQKSGIGPFFFLFKNFASGNPGRSVDFGRWDKSTSLSSTSTISVYDDVELLTHHLPDSGTPKTDSIDDIEESR